jgi:hypothetical protein
MLKQTMSKVNISYLIRLLIHYRNWGVGGEKSINYYGMEREMKNSC